MISQYKKILFIVALLTLCFFLVKLVDKYSCTPKAADEEVVKKINDDLFLLSSKGCSRATAYANMSKIAFVNDVAIISWLGIHDDEFIPTIAVYDLKNKKILNRYAFDKSVDNHGGPALVVDSENRIHVFYYPHSQQKVKYKVGTLTNNNEIIWECKDNIGEPHLTYPNPVYNKDQGLLLFARKTIVFNDPAYPPPTFGFFKADENHSQFHEILSSRDSGYASFFSRILLSDEKIQILSRVLENGDSSNSQYRETICYLESTDKGETWQKENKKKNSCGQRDNLSTDNQQFKNPATADQTSVIESAGIGNGSDLGVLGMYNNSDGVNAYYMKEQLSDSKIIKATKNLNTSKWSKVAISDSIHPKLEGQRWVQPTGNLIKNKELVLLVGVLQDDSIGRMSKWGHKSNSVVLLAEEKGNCKKLIEFKNKNTCVWFPYIQVNGNDLLLIFTKKGSDFIITDNNNTQAESKVFLFHIKLNELLNRDFETIFI